MQIYQSSIKRWTHHKQNIKLQDYDGIPMGYKKIGISFYMMINPFTYNQLPSTLNQTEWR